MAGGGDESHGKRKREEGSERKAKAARFSKARQERLEQEFAETYGGLTALYKLLEIKQLQSPLLLPRALSYRLPRATKGAEKKLKKPAKATARRDPPVSGAVMRDVKLGLTSDLLETLKNENHRLGLRLAIYSADGSEFADNLFTLVAECTIPVPWFKEVRIPAKVLPQHADIVVVTLQVVEIGDLAEKLAQETAFMFAPPAKTATAETTAGKTLLTANTNGRAPLYGNLLRIKVAQRRTGQFEVDLPSISSSMGGGVKCQFRLEWDPLPKAAKMQRLAAVCKAKFAMESADPLNQEGFKLAIPKRDIRSLGDGQNCSGVWFHFLYHSMLRRMSEKRPDYSCAWCNMYAGSLRGLVAHLVSSHDRFRFQATVGHDNIPHIYVMVVGTRPPTLGGDGAVRSALCELEMSRDDELDRFEHHFSYKSTTKYGNGRGKRSSSVPGADAVDAIMQEFDELDELSQDQPQEFYAPLLQRQYFHSRTGAVVLDHEKDYDSDDDVDEEWIIQQSEKLLDEFEDVALEEKEFMKKWNRHVKEYKILADFMVASSCRLFAKRHGKWLLDHGLRHNFLLHLLNLWDNSLLNSRAIIDCMLIVDHLAVVEKATNTDDSAGKPLAASAAKPSAASAAAE